MPGLGNITQDGYTVWCGTCSEWQSWNHAINKRDCANEAKKDGWRIVDGKWTCPGCLNKDGKRNDQT